MTLFITYLRQKYILVFLFSFLFSFASAKGDDNFKYTSIPHSTTISYLDILTEGEITFNNDGVLVISNENEKVLYSTKENIKLQSGKKIVFKPGTKIEPKKGERLSASITDANIEEERELKTITHELSKLFNEKDSTKSSFNKNKDDRSVLFSSISCGLIIDNQQRRVGNIKTITQRFSANILKSEYRFFQTTSGFKPITVEVLRL